MEELVSIIVPCYNGGLYLRNFMDSVLNQKYSRIELLLVDDGSTDNTYEIIETYKSSFESKGYQLYYFYKDNGGQASAINVALQKFKGDYLMWVDSDDILLPTNVSDKVVFLKEHLDCGLVLSQGYIVNSYSLDTEVGILSRTHLGSEKKGQLFHDLIYEKNVIYGPGTVLVRRKCIYKAIPTLHIFESKAGQNWQLMLPLTYMFKTGYIDKPLFKYVVHDDSHSHKSVPYDALIERLEQHFQIKLNTIVAIPGMSCEEMDYWKHILEVMYLRKKIYLSYDFKRYIEAKKYYQKLKKIGERSFGDGIVGYIWIKIMRKIDNIFK